MESYGDLYMDSYRLEFDSVTGLAGLAAKLSVFSRSRLSLTQPAKLAKPAKVFYC
jgi:hypothetical protein